MQQLQDTIWQIESNILLTEEIGGVIGGGGVGQGEGLGAVESTWDYTSLESAPLGQSCDPRRYWH